MKRVPTLMLLVLVPLAAQAQSQSATVLMKEGERLYQQGEYRKAAEVLIQAQEIAPAARLLYNIARAYDQAGDLLKAESYYQQYVISNEDTEALLLKRAALALDRLRRQMQKDEAAAAAAEAERKRLEQAAAEARARAEAEAEAARRAEQAHRLRLEADYRGALATRQRLQVASLAAGGLSVLSVATGLYQGLQARASLERLPQVSTLEAKRRLAADARTQALLADIGFGVALVTAATAVLLYPKGAPPSPPPGMAVLTPAPRGLGAGLEVRF